MKKVRSPVLDVVSTLIKDTIITPNGDLEAKIKGNEIFLKTSGAPRISVSKPNLKEEGVPHWATYKLTIYGESQNGSEEVLNISYLSSIGAVLKGYQKEEE